MAIWEFQVEADHEYDLSHTVLAEGDSAAEAAGSGMTIVPAGFRLVRPGRLLTPGSAARWRELTPREPFPMLAPLHGRLGRWARGLPPES
jgi:hypothetical protein